VENKAISSGKCEIKPWYVSWVAYTCKFLDWICKKSSSRLVAQMKDEFLIQVPKTADGFWAAIGALQSLGE
jgi:hypothetical protein